jgi:hypothetical protein
MPVWVLSSKRVLPLARSEHGAAKCLGLLVTKARCKPDCPKTHTSLLLAQSHALND